MNIILIIIILVLSIAVAALSIGFFLYSKKSTFIPDKDKEFIEFTIDMYIQYAEELNIHSPKQHKKIVEQLERIKNKYFKKENEKN